MLVKQAEHAANQPSYVQQGDYHQRQAVAPAPPNATVYVNQGDPYESTASGQEEVMDHSGAYESVTQEMFPTQTVDNSQLRQQVMQPDGQVLMDISSANPTVEFTYDYGNVLQGGSFTSQLDPSIHVQNKQQVVTSPRLASPVEQPQLPPYPTSPPQHHQTPLEEIQIQAQQLQSRGNNILSPTNQFVGNVDPFNTARQMDASSQQRKGRLPRNVSDTQLYTMDLSQLGTSLHTNLFPSMESNLPPQLEAPNLAAHLQSIQPRTRIPSLPTASNAKRVRLPRNMSDSKLSSLASMSRSPTSPPSLPTVHSSEIANQPSHPAPNPTHHSGRKKRGGFPRIMSDSSLLSLGQQPHQRLPPAPAAAPSTSQRRRKMSTPEHLGNTVAALSSQSPTFASTADTPQLTGSLTTNANLLEQLLLAPVANPTPVASESYQTNSSVLGQLLTQPSPSNAAVPMQTRDTGNVSGTQDPSLLNQLYQLKQVLQKQSVPTELVNALSTLSNAGTTQATQHKQEQPQAVQHKTAPMQPSLQMKPQNQNVITQALQSLLRAPPNVAIQPTTSSKPTTPVSNFTSQSPLQAALITSNSAPVPTVTIKHTPSNKVPVPAVNQNVLPQAAVIISPQGNLQTVQDTPTGQMGGVPEVSTSSMPQVVNVGHPTVQGQRILLPASVNLSTLSLAQLGLSPATLQSVSSKFFIDGIL